MRKSVVGLLLSSGVLSACLVLAEGPPRPEGEFEVVEAVVSPEFFPELSERGIRVTLVADAKHIQLVDSMVVVDPADQELPGIAINADDASDERTYLVEQSAGCMGGDAINIRVPATPPFRFRGSVPLVLGEGYLADDEILDREVQAGGPVPAEPIGPGRALALCRTLDSVGADEAEQPTGDIDYVLIQPADTAVQMTVDTPGWGPSHRGGIPGLHG